MQVFFNGTQVRITKLQRIVCSLITNFVLFVQNIAGLNSTEFASNAIAVAAWKATVCSACAKNLSEYIRVDILSLEDLANRRLLTTHEPQRRLKTTFILSVKINFKVSFTLQDFNSNDVNATTRVLKANFQQSVSNNSFVKEFALEVKRRTNESQALIDKFQPSEVAFGSSYVVVQTTDHPTFKPTFSPSTGNTCLINI